MKDMSYSKKILAVLLTMVLVFGGCGNKDNLAISDTSSSTETVSATMEESVYPSTETESETESASTEETETESETAEHGTETAQESDLLPDTAFQTVEETVYAISNVNLRRQPTTEQNNVETVLQAGAQAVRTGYRDDWSILEYQGQKLYASSTYLTTDAPQTPSASESEGSDVAQASEQNNEQDSTQPAAQPTAPAVTPSANGGGRIVCIDAGHQQHGISDTEPNGPGSTEMKAKLTTGTQGVATGKTEYQLNLEVSLLLKQELLNRGYQVVMIRETNDCPASNAERAITANESGASIFVRIHANSSTDSSTNGCLTMAPTAANPYVSYLAAPSQSLSQSIVNHICANTGFRNIGVLGTDNMTGINWCTIPVSIVEMGYMSNPDEDVKMSDPTYQSLIASGIADGIDEYFASH